MLQIIILNLIFLHLAPGAPEMAVEACAARGCSCTLAWRPPAAPAAVRGYVLELDDGLGGPFRVSCLTPLMAAVFIKVLRKVTNYFFTFLGSILWKRNSLHYRRVALRITIQRSRKSLQWSRGRTIQWSHRPTNITRYLVLWIDYLIVVINAKTLSDDLSLETHVLKIPFDYLAIYSSYSSLLDSDLQSIV